MSRLMFLVQLLVSGWLPSLALAQEQPGRLPIIDVHLHALGVEALRAFGPNPITRAAPPGSVEEHVQRTLAEMRRYNVVIGIVGGSSMSPGNSKEEVARFLAAAPDRVWGSAAFGRPDSNVDSLRAQYAAGNSSPWEKCWRNTRACHPPIQHSSRTGIWPSNWMSRWASIPG